MIPRLIAQWICICLSAALAASPEIGLDSRMESFRSLTRSVQSLTTNLEYLKTKVERRHDASLLFKKFAIYRRMGIELQVNEIPSSVPLADAIGWLDAVKAKLLVQTDDEADLTLLKIVHKNQLRMQELITERNGKEASLRSALAERDILVEYLLTKCEKEGDRIRREILSIHSELTRLDASPTRFRNRRFNVLMWLQTAPFPSRTSPTSDNDVLISTVEKYLRGELSELPELALGETERKLVYDRLDFPFDEELRVGELIAEARAQVAILEEKQVMLKAYADEIKRTLGEERKALVKR